MLDFAAAFIKNWDTILQCFVCSYCSNWEKLQTKEKMNDLIQITSNEESQVITSFDRDLSIFPPERSPESLLNELQWSKSQAVC